MDDGRAQTKPAQPLSVPVFVMLPLNTVKADGQLNNPEQLRGALKVYSVTGTPPARP